MKRIAALCLLAFGLVSGCHAASPSLSSFDQTYFTTNNLFISLRTNWISTNSITTLIVTNLYVTNLYSTNIIVNGTNVATLGDLIWTNDTALTPSRIRVKTGISDFYTELTNTFTRGYSADDFIFPVLALGNNTLDSDLYSAFLLLSPTNDPAQVIIRLKSPLAANNLELMCYTNAVFTGQCRLVAGSAVSGSGGTVRLNNNQDWDGINGAVIRLRYISPDWIEVGRWFAGSNSQPTTITINPTDTYLPERQSADVFKDSPLFSQGTNIATQAVSVWTNSLSGDNGVIYVGTGDFVVKSGVQTLSLRNATHIVTFDANALLPNSNDMTLGGDGVEWNDLHLSDKLYFGPGLTNTFFRSASDFVLENDDTTGFTLNLRGTGGDATYSVGPSGSPIVSSTTPNAPVYLLSGNNAAGLMVAATSIQPITETVSIGFSSSNGAWVDQYFKGTLRQQGVNDGAGNTTSLEITHRGNAGDIELKSNAAGTQTFRPIAVMVGSTNVAKFDTTSAAGETRFWLYDEDNGTMERVTVGIPDSGGAGYKLLRIPN